jgi:ABC-2 type transport system permease protein
MLRDLWILLWKDLQVTRSYRFAFIVQTASLVAPLALLVFINRALGQVDVPAISRYGGNYVSFMLLGVVVTTFSATSLSAFSRSLRAAQVTGTLEAMLFTRARLPVLLVGSSLYAFARESLRMAVYIGGGFLVLGLAMDNVNIAAAVTVFVTFLLVMISLGILAASFTLVFKQGDPVTMLLIAGSGFLSGVVYPVAVLPLWLQRLAQALPQTHAIEALRLSVLSNAGFSDIAPQLIVLGMFTVLLFPLALLAFSAAMDQARVDGSLAHF